MMQRQLSVEDICKKLRPVFGSKIDRIYLKYAMAESREEKEDIARMLSALFQKNLNELLDDKVLLEPPKKNVIDGDYNLASVSYSGKKLFPFTLRERDWPRHVCVTGMSGSGKTTLAFNILQTFIDHDKPFLVFDWKKSFRPLLAASNDVMVFTIGNDSVSNLFKMNINHPPKGVDPKEWINVLCDLLAESFFASYGVHKVLLETLDEAFRQFGVYDGSNNYPTWDHIKWYLEEKFKKSKGREGGWVESALRIATVLTFGNFGKICNYKERDSLSVEDLLDKKVILELNSLSSVEKKFFCEFVLAYIFKMKKAGQGSASNGFDHAILVDEAHNIFLKESPHFTKESVTDMVYREMREYGTSLICLDQHISKLSDTVKGNSACHIAFQQQLPADIYDIAGLMQAADRKQFFSMLPVGSAIVKLSERYTSPFLVEVSPVELREQIVTYDDIKKRTQNLIQMIEVQKGADIEFKKKLMTPEQKPVKVENSYNEKLVLKVDDKVIDASTLRPRDPSAESYGVEKPMENLVYGVVVAEEVSKEKADLDEFQKLELIISENEKNVLTPKQKILHGFVVKRLSERDNLVDLENELEMYKDEGEYTSYDVGVVVNYVLKNRIKGGAKKEVKPSFKVAKTVTTSVKEKIYKPKTSSDSGNKALDNEQKMFIAFLQENPTQTLGTVDFYKRLGFSSRKGNKIKNDLLESGLIEIREEKNDKGWKKVIRLA